MNLLHVNPFFHPFVGGTEKYLYDLCTRLAKKHEVSVLTAQLSGTQRFEKIGGVKVIRVPSLVFEKLPSPLPPPYAIPLAFPYFFKKACDSQKPDIVHVHNRFFPRFASPPLLKRLGLVKKPVFFSIHNARTVGISPLTDLLGQTYDAFLGNLFLRNADFLIANSAWTLRVTKPPDYPNAQTRVVYNGVDTKKYRPAKKRVQDKLKNRLGCERFSITVCRLLPQKGLEYLVRGVHELKKGSRLKSAEFKAVVIGRGPERARLERLARELGVQDSVVFEGFIPEEYMPAYYSAAECSVLPSLYEPFGIVLAESMACGTPCIATRVSGIPEVVGNTGLLIPPRSPEKTAQALNYFIRADSKKRFSRKARARAVKLFDWSVIVKQVEKTYETFLSFSSS